jgi:hypothetical protein
MIEDVAPALRSAFALCAAACALACAAPAPVVSIPAPAPPPPCERIASLEVHKDARTLVARCEGGAVETFRVALGREPAGAKRAAGDLRTPEGDYRIAGPARASRFHLFIPIDYPSAADADAARAQGRLSASDHARILAAHERGELPPEDTPLGGRLGFHGEGERWRGDSADLDWTYGCLALDDRSIEFLAERAPPGTPVRIER